MLILPPTDLDEQYPIHDYQVDLEGSVYRYVLTYRERQESWYLDLYGSDDSALIMGKRLSINWPILTGHVNAGLPPGQILLLDSSASEAECSYADLGNRCLLVYVPADEIPETSTTYTVSVS